MPCEETELILPNILSSRGYLSGRTIGRAVGKSGTSGVPASSKLLGKTRIATPKPPEIPYIISHTRPYNTEEEIILRVTI
jgi:hypothetical protein